MESGHSRPNMKHYLQYSYLYVFCLPLFSLAPDKQTDTSKQEDRKHIYYSDT